MERPRTLAVWQLERVQFCIIHKTHSDAERCGGKSEDPSSETRFDTANATEQAAPKRPLNEPFASDFVRHERAETLKREKRGKLGCSMGHDEEKRDVQVTDAVDLEIDTRNMASVFFSSLRCNRRERPGERGKRKCSKVQSRRLCRPQRNQRCTRPESIYSLLNEDTETR